jgi:serine protease Do
MMTRQFAWITAGLSAVIGVLVGLIVSGTVAPARVAPAPTPASTTARTEPVAVERTGRSVAAGNNAINFADVAERLNPAVVNIDATARGRRQRAPQDGQPKRPDIFQDPFDLRRPRTGDVPRRGMGTGFIIDAEGHILTNQHVIDGADRLTVKLTDGRSFRAEVVGSDPDTDIALIKVDADAPLPHATLGDSDRLRVGEWVCAIGNPLAYEHTVTVGVVSFIGRKLFDSTLDNYIQTDAAISFGNSGGPLINARGQVIGINSAVSRQSNNIGFAVPINQARAILPQLKTVGKVMRGFIGVALRDVDQELQASLRLTRSDGALVQDVTPGSPGARAGLRPYDLIVKVDGEPVRTNDTLIREIAMRAPGTVARLEFLRDGRAREVSVKLAERPTRNAELPLPAERSGQRIGPGELGLALIEIDGTNVHRFDVPQETRGLLVQSVEPLSAAYEGGIERGQVILEINRQPVETVVGFRRVVAAVPAGSVLAVYLYDPDRDERTIRTIRTESR